MLMNIYTIKVCVFDGWMEGWTGDTETHPTCGDDGVLEDIAAQLAAQFY